METLLLFINRMVAPDSFVRTLICILIYVYQPITSTVFDFLLGCFKFGSSHVMISKTDLNCWTTTEYWLWAIFLYIPMLVSLTAIPLVFVLFMRLNRKRLHEGKLANCLGVFFDVYKRDYYWFEVASFARKILLAVSWNASLSLSFRVRGVHYFFYSLIFSGYWLLLVLFNPYRLRDENKFDKICYFVLIILCSFQEGSNIFSESIGVILSFLLTCAVTATLILFVLRHSVLGKAARKLKNMLVSRCIRKVRIQQSPTDKNDLHSQRISKHCEGISQSDSVVDESSEIQPHFIDRTPDREGNRQGAYVVPSSALPHAIFTETVHPFDFGSIRSSSSSSGAQSPYSREDEM
mmetsp:Transcript_3910/g.14791  ORF Transcript_3910/g.14791 Transcript_3910/m.14791 type:complete len:350 (-) Transcript_3910:2158-3207(-)